MLYVENQLLRSWCWLKARRKSGVPDYCTALLNNGRVAESGVCETDVSLVTDWPGIKISNTRMSRKIWRKKEQDHRESEMTVSITRKKISTGRDKHLGVDA